MRKSLLSMAAAAVCIAASASTTASLVELTKFEKNDFTRQAVEKTVSARFAKKAQKVAAASETASMDDILGEYINETETYYEDPVWAGGSVTVVKGEGENEIILKDFPYAGCQTKAVVDFATGTFSIPVQEVYEHQTYGKMSIAPAAISGGQLVADRTKAITGQFIPGVFLIQKYGVFIDSGTYAGYAWDGFYETYISEANGVMTNKWYNNMYEDEVFNVAIEADYDAVDSVWVYNFNNNGMPVQMKVSEDGSVSIPQQVVIDLSNVNTSSTYSTDAVLYKGIWSASGYQVAQGDLPGTIDENGVITVGQWGPVATKRSTGGLTLFGVYNSSTIVPVKKEEPSAVTDVNTNKTVASVKYVNLQGQESATPFQGVNIKVSTFTDGSSAAVKVMK
ncbi:MAG: hypothetical protein Q4B68_04900 [Bacteroidales bacterium]|nr:hypothetical protein [Bacteroidales bacterium]